jgi:RNA polymerase sigma-70 factor (ECF subfamily)
LYAELPPEAATKFDGQLGRFLLDSKALKPMHRVCLILKYVHGLSREEIAGKLGLTDNQVKGNLQYALELLREELAGSTGKARNDGPRR